MLDRRLIAALQIEEELCSGRERGLHRSIELAAPGLDLSSNDYLGLAEDPEQKRRLLAALERTSKIGATGSRLLGGETIAHAETERWLASVFETESALLFSSGYAANLGVLGALASGSEAWRAGTEFFSDQLNHASLIDGLRLAKAKSQIFAHNDMSDLENRLRDSTALRKIIVIESVYSMDGDLAPLPELLKLAKTYESWLVIDEAHATGVFGRQSLGRLSDCRAEVPIISIHTGGKALGAQGAFVTSDLCVRELLINRARTFIFSTGLSPILTLQMRLAIERILEESGWGEELLAKSDRLRLTIGRCGNSASQILPVIVGSSERALRLAQALQDQGFYTRAIRAPTVAPGTERLRLTIKRLHREDDLNRLALAIEKELRNG